jgi:GNAT superfamily N-acetyltransferase
MRGNNSCAFNRNNRPYFDEITVHALRQPDVIDISAYYSRHPSSGFWILEFNEKLIGIIALDAAPQVDPDEPSSKKKKSLLSSPTAVIRHFYVEEPYRKSNIQTDLLTHAVEHAFRSGPSLERIEASETPLARYIQKSLRSLGFQLKEHTKTVGIYGWKLGRAVLERSEWENREEARKTR